MSAILIALGCIFLIMVVLFLVSKEDDPYEKEKEKSNKEETSEKIVWMDGYEPMWEKEIEL